MNDADASETIKPKTADGRSKIRSAALNIIPPFLFGSLIIGGWYFISYVMLAENRRFLLRPPDKVVTEGFLDWGGTGGMACRDVHVGRHGSVLANRDLHLGRHRSVAAIRDSHLG